MTKLPSSEEGDAWSGALVNPLGSPLQNTKPASYSPILKHRCVLTRLWRAWASTPLVIVSCSLLIGYLRTLGRLYPVWDMLENLVGIGFSGLVCLPLIIGACYLHLNTTVPRWLSWVPITLVMPLGLVMFITYVFGDLGVSIRTLTTSIFEHV